MGSLGCGSVADGRLALGRLARVEARRLARRRRFLRLEQHPGAEAGAGRQQEERNLGQAGDEAEHDQHARRDGDGLRVGGELRADVLAQVVALLLAADARHDDAGAGGDEDGGDHAHQTVADGEQRVLLRRVADLHAPLHHADDEAADDVDDGDDDAGDGVALHELHRAVHGAEQLALALEVAALALALLHVDGAGAQVRVDGHLLAGHGVEGEARGDFGDALRALGDDDEVHDGEDDEDDRADDEVALDHEVTERDDDLARVAGEQDQAGRGDGQRQPVHRRDQQQRREHRQLQRRAARTAR